MAVATKLLSHAIHDLKCCGAQVAAGLGQFPPPSFVVGMEELTSIPDAKAHNRYACYRLMQRLLQSKVSVVPAAPQ
jgi:hypothetical protein